MKKKIKFTCPICNGSQIFEKETGPLIIRELTGIDTQYQCVLYDNYWANNLDDCKKWHCSECNWRLPVKSPVELIKYLEGKN